MGGGSGGGREEEVKGAEGKEGGREGRSFVSRFKMRACG